MDAADKLKIATSFRRAMDNDPASDTPISDIIIAGKPATRRQIFSQSLNRESFYDEVEGILEREGITLDHYIEETVKHWNDTKIYKVPPRQPIEGGLG